AVADATNLLDARARREAERSVAVRVGTAGGNVYLDLCDPTWRAVEIGTGGWRLTGRSPVPFRRTKSMRPLPAPARGGSIADLRPFLNVGAEDDFILTVAVMIAALRGVKPYPI